MNKIVTKFVIALALIFQVVNLAACSVCLSEMDEIEAALKSAVDYEFMTQGEVDSYQDGFGKAIEMITRNHPLNKVGK